MNEAYWHNKWDSQQIGFHLDDVHPMLLTHFTALNLKQGQRVFVPLCGKTLDMVWLAQQGLEVLGCELVESAVEQFFHALNVPPQIKQVGTLKQYSANNITLFVGNIFDLTPERLGEIHGIYDRAAYVALPQHVRKQYAEHTQAITSNANRLLVTFQYDPSKMEGPPFAIPEQEVRDAFGASQRIEKLEARIVEGKLKGKVDAQEIIYRLTQAT